MKRAFPDVIMGGLAVQYWGEPRATRDVDITVMMTAGREQVVIDRRIRHGQGLDQPIPITSKPRALAARLWYRLDLNAKVIPEQINLENPSAHPLRVQTRQSVPCLPAAAALTANTSNLKGHMCEIIGIGGNKDWRTGRKIGCRQSMIWDTLKMLLKTVTSTGLVSLPSKVRKRL
ncbi:hypothetical protein MYX75_00560 [Acidobacteria bacterium AH-259-A15]|nr:hypothetical protein [Acidobacteria bacterium AH-259-A15]